MTHRTSRTLRPGSGWQARCRCGWRSEWCSDDQAARAAGRAHEAHPEAPDWSVVERWLAGR